MNIFRSSSVNVENNVDGGLLTSSNNNSNNIINKRRSREQRSSDSSSNQIVAITDKQTKSLLRERDAKIAALEKEVLGLQNKISSLSKEQAAMMGSQRKGKKGLTPYGNTVRVSTSKCSAKRRQVRRVIISRHVVASFVSGFDFVNRFRSHSTLPTNKTASRRTCENGPECLHLDTGNPQLPPGRNISQGGTNQSCPGHVQESNRTCCLSKVGTIRP